MNKRYNILWLDDKFEDLIDFTILAENNNIDLEGYKSFEEGFQILERNLGRFDGVLLDALFYEFKDQVNGEGEEALGSAIARLNELKAQKVLPWFILSAQDSFTKNGNSILKANKKRCFDKINHNDLIELFKTIKQEADKLEDTKIRHRYQQVFDVCTKEYIGEGAAIHLLPILRSINDGASKIEDQLYFNRLRIIVEDVFRAANKFGFLHDQCIRNGNVVLKNSFQFLTKQKVKISDEKLIYCTKKHFPALIERAVENILDITNVASHSETTDKERGRLELNDYRQTVNSPFLLYSLTFQLLDVLLWFKNYADQNKDYAKNFAHWKDEPISKEGIYTGVIEQDDSGNYYCGEYLLMYSLIGEQFKLGDRVMVVEAVPNNKPKTKEKYPKFAQRINKFSSN